MRRSVEKFISLSKPLGKLQIFTFRNVQPIEIKTIYQMPKQELLIQKMNWGSVSVWLI